MNEFVLFAGLLSFAMAYLVARSHFSSRVWPREAHFTVVLACVGVTAFAYFMWRDQHSTNTLVAALCLFLAGFALFLWSVKATRSRRPKAAFDPEPPNFLTRDGPYAYIRHPFYASYILFWLACAVATSHFLIFVFFVAYTATFLILAYREERTFDRSPLAAEYADYRKTAGLLWPKLHWR
ncbi:MAG TPA: isoprenylcysteine carboxylmethyltransferase family protein [Pseudolabrys sp.]|nr:isoprenylcysteine carboxylmethyltransferase family protein [Pseudolabrys sp.]